MDPATLTLLATEAELAESAQRLIAESPWIAPAAVFAGGVFMPGASGCAGADSLPPHPAPTSNATTASKVRMCRMRPCMIANRDCR